MYVVPSTVSTRGENTWHSFLVPGDTLDDIADSRNTANYVERVAVSRFGKDQVVWIQLDDENPIIVELITAIIVNEVSLGTVRRRFPDGFNKFDEDRMRAAIKRVSNAQHWPRCLGTMGSFLRTLSLRRHNYKDFATNEGT
jgi:hypothetical protein